MLDFTILQLTSQEEWPLPVNINKLWRRKAEFRRPTGNQQQGKLTRHVRRWRNCPEVEGDPGRPQRKAPVKSTALRMHIRRMTCKNQQQWSSDLQVHCLKPALICFLHFYSDVFTCLLTGYVKCRFLSYFIHWRHSLESPEMTKFCNQPTVE